MRVFEIKKQTMKRTIAIKKMSTHEMNFKTALYDCKTEKKKS